MDYAGENGGKSSEIWDTMEVAHPTHYRNFIKFGKNDGVVWQIGGRASEAAEKTHGKADLASA